MRSPMATFLAAAALSAACTQPPTKSSIDPVAEDLEVEARAVLTAICDLIVAADSVGPVPAAPLDTSHVEFENVTGKHIVSQEGSDLMWNLLSLSTRVAPFLEGEVPNGMDDNGNGLIDEKGFSFVRDRRAMTVRLTLEEGDLQKTIETTVTTATTATTAK
ncbi:MAG: hypothetical protein GY711_03345 [bacterium]|nr:hypothetical protein [bacterium]